MYHVPLEPEFETVFPFKTGMITLLLLFVAPANDCNPVLSIFKCIYEPPVTFRKIYPFFGAVYGKVIEIALDQSGIPQPTIVFLTVCVGFILLKSTSALPDKRAVDAPSAIGDAPK